MHWPHALQALLALSNIPAPVLRPSIRSQKTELKGTTSHWGQVVPTGRGGLSTAQMLREPCLSLIRSDARVLEHLCDTLPSSSISVTVLHSRPAGPRLQPHSLNPVSAIASSLSALAAQNCHSCHSVSTVNMIYVTPLCQKGCLSQTVS